MIGEKLIKKYKQIKKYFPWEGYGMGQINKNNYQAFFLDYHEGNLSPQQVADLLLFVEQHTELKEEFESFENFSLEDFPSIEFKNKSSLKKDLPPALSKEEETEFRIDTKNYQNYLFRSVENTLNSDKKNILNNFIKQHPLLLPEFELFQKTKLLADSSIVFENKDELKRDLSPSLSKGVGDLNLSNRDLALISSIEGLLSQKETALLNQSLSVDSKMKQEFDLFQKTKLTADLSIVFENKVELKRNLSPALSQGEGAYGEKDDSKKKVIPFYYYFAVAASLLILFGLYFIFNNNKTENYAKNKAVPKIENSHKNQLPLTVLKEETQVAVATNSTLQKKQPVSKIIDKSTNSSTSGKQEIEITILKNHEEIIPLITENSVKNKTQINNEEEINNNQQATINNPVIADIEQKNEIINSKEFLTLRELATEKIKQKTLDKNTLAVEKKNGHLKKFNAWDFAQLAAKGISKLTGRKVQVKPTYNDQGDITAYALCAGGLEFSKANKQP